LKTWPVATTKPGVFGVRSVSLALTTTSEVVFYQPWMSEEILIATHPDGRLAVHGLKLGTHRSCAISIACFSLASFFTRISRLL
jgi:hypothetical protein